ncbi:MAG: hypothetical protein WKF58_12315 [Ilumatobacteraceae bacterium]
MSRPRCWRTTGRRGRRSPRRHGGAIARRVTCPSAPGERCATSAPTDYSSLGAEIVLANTYHLMLRPGAETVAHLGGLGALTGWDGLDAHRLRRLPGLLARTRRRRRRGVVRQRVRRQHAPADP